MNNLETINDIYNRVNREKFVAMNRNKIITELYLSDDLFKIIKKSNETIYLHQATSFPIKFMGLDLFIVSNSFGELTKHLRVV